LGFYFGGLIILIIIGDAFAHRIARKINPMKKYEGVFLQTSGHIGRQRAISRIFFDNQRRKFVYRGVAFDDTFTGQPAASWEAVMGNQDLVDGDRVLYFSGKACVEGCNFEYHPETFKQSVFTILRFSGLNRFKGGGFDFEWKPKGDGKRGSFPIMGDRVDPDYLNSHRVSDDVLLDGLYVSDSDRVKIFAYARESESSSLSQTD